MRQNDLLTWKILLFKSAYEEIYAIAIDILVLSPKVQVYLIARV